MAPLTDEGFDAFVADLLHARAKEPPAGLALTPATRLDDLGFDSLDALEALTFAEEVAAVDRPSAVDLLATDDPAEWTCLGDVYRVVVEWRDGSVAGEPAEAQQWQRQHDQGGGQAGDGGGHGPPQPGRLRP